MKRIFILGIRGIPAQHGGFETLVENLAPFLAEEGYRVTVYCQEEGKGAHHDSNYKNVVLRHVPVSGTGALSTLKFDCRSVIDAVKHDGLFLMFGYGSGFLTFLTAAYRKTLIVNMDGVEWKRKQHGVIGRWYLYVNERISALFASHLVADHPEIKVHLASRASAKKISMISYGGPHATKITEEEAELILKNLGLGSDQYLLVVARPEPDNSILEIVTAFGAKKRGVNLILLGNFKNEVRYHRKVLSASSDEVLFPGAIYDDRVVRALRENALFYIHGHTVGGTNPSLVESLAAGSATLAHDNKFNRWVAGKGAIYFSDQKDLAKKLEHLLMCPEVRKDLSEKASERFLQEFRWERILRQYQSLIEKLYPSKS